MNWRFTLIDRNNTPHVINEPVGWDAMIINLDRDEDKHGVMIDFQENNFDIHGLGYKIIKQEYEQYGVEGDLTFVIDWGCADKYEELHRGKLNFAQSSSEQGPKCFFTISIEAMSDILEVINRIDQSVNLLSDKAFDGVTTLPSYSKLGFSLPLPSKGIVLENKAENTEAITVSILGAANTCNASNGISEAGVIEIPFNKIISSEIGGFSFPASTEGIYSEVGGTCIPLNPDVVQVPGAQGNLVWPDGIAPTVNYTQGFSGFGQIANNTPVEISFKLKGSIAFSNAGPEGIQCVFYRRSEQDQYEWIWDNVINDYHFPISSPHTFNFDLTYSNSLFINEGDRFYLNLIVNHSKTTAQAATGNDAYNLVFDATNYFKMKCLSHTKTTTTKAFMVNEVFSRVVESISNGKMRAYSDHFGRTDSEPYSTATDGCDSLESVTKGIFIRRQENRNGNTAVFALSLKDMWEGLNPIHNLGYGFELDPNRPGFNRLRIEHWKFFYNNEIILSCKGVFKVKTKVMEKEHYSTLQIGYQKWEAEEYNGLDEFLTKRRFRTSLSQVKNELVQLSSFVGSGYAWEITRRKGDQDSKDWRYDNDTFISCLVRDQRNYAITLTGTFYYTGFITDNDPAGILPGDEVTISGSTLNDGAYSIDFISSFGNSGTWGIYFNGTVTPEGPVTITITRAVSGFVVEIGNVLSPENIINPSTVYNWRIRPAYNAMRWMDKVLASYKQANPNNSIIFMNGEGNYFAKGEMQSTVCKMENGPIAENGPITSALFLEALQAAAILSPERKEYDFPMSIKDFKRIKAKPFGLIYFENESTKGVGWVDKLSYKPQRGIASFSLIPRYGPLSFNNGLASEEGFGFVLEEDGLTQITVN